MFYCSLIPVATAELLSRLASNPPSSHIQRRKTSFRDAQSCSSVCGAENQERKAPLVPKPPWALLPKTKRTKIVPKREMPVADPILCRRSLLPAGDSAQQGAQAGTDHFPVPAAQHPVPGPSRAIRLPGCVPRFLLGCMDALSGTQEPLCRGQVLQQV